MRGTIYYSRPDILDAIPKDRHTVIEASAGTGKTFTIEHLFIELLLTQKVNIDNLLVLTYTERAAGELRSRIRTMIEKVLATEPVLQNPGGRCWKIGIQEKVHLERALFSFDMAPIHTIHSFFQRVVNEHAFNSGRLFEQSLVDGKSAFREAFLETLRKELSCDEAYAPYLDAWLAGGRTLDALHDALYACHARKRAILPSFDETALLRAFEDLASIVQMQGLPERLQADGKANKIHGSTVKALVARLERFSELLDGAGRKFNLCDLVVGCNPEWTQYTLDKCPAGRSWSEPVRAYIEALGQVRRHYVTIRGIVAQRFLPVVQRRLDAMKRTAGLYDYDDMIDHLLEALEGNQRDALISALRSRYRYALIDESQDTDERQWRIFEHIFVRSGGRNILYLVGDPKQAIYGFRGADVFTYLSARNTLCAHQAPVRLVSNYRSTATLINAFNEIFGQDGDAPFFRGRITYDNHLACGKPEFRVVDRSGRDIAPVVLWELGSDVEKVHTTYYLNVMGRAIAVEIRNLIAGGIADLKPNDIFILTRKESEGRRVAAFLREAGLPFAFYKLNGLFQTPQAEHIRDLLLAVEHPFDESRRFRAWMTPFFGVPIDQLLNCKGLPEGDPLVKRLLDWHVLARRRNFPELFSSIIHESGLVRRIIFFEESERELTDYLHILEMLLEEAGTGGKELADLNQMLSDCIEGVREPAREDGTIQRLETDKEAIQIMTMHKSKGLEASVVFLYGGYGAAPSNDFQLYHEESGRAVIHIDGMAEHKQSAQEERDDEDRRLLYVATTRAKARLYLPYIPPEKYSKTVGMYRLLNDRLDAMVRDRATLERKGMVMRTPPFAASGTSGNENITDVCARVQFSADEHNEQREAERFAALREQHAGFEVTSYSRMKRVSEGHAGSEGDEDAIYDDRVAEGGRKTSPLDTPSGPRFGKALHAVMEQIRFQELVEAKGDSETWKLSGRARFLAERALACEGVGGEHADYLLTLVYNALMSSIVLADGSRIPGIVMADEVASEVEFLYPFPEEGMPGIAESHWQEITIGRGFVKGFIDLAFTWNGKVHFCDWKTDILPDYSPEKLSGHFALHYDLQSKLYLMALCKLLGISTETAYQERIGSIVYCFVRGMHPDAGQSGVLVSRPAWSELLTFEQKLIRGTMLEGALS